MDKATEKNLREIVDSLKKGIEERDDKVVAKILGKKGLAQAFGNFYDDVEVGDFKEY